MKRFKINPLSTRISWLIVCAALLLVFSGCDDNKTETPTLTVTTVASGLAGPMGIETDNQGNIWVSEAGTDTSKVNNGHDDDGKVVVITPDGQKYDAIIHLSSYANIHSHELQGTVHILNDNGTLYVLSGDYLYRADISQFKPGDTPIDAGTLSKEDIAAFASQHAVKYNPENDSHPYNLTKGPDGDLYITDAGANAIIHRTGVNDYSILAEIPSFDNPTPQMGGPTVQSVPTSIAYDGSDFLVTTLTGFPFPAGQAIIYKVSMSGNISVYQKGFTMLVDQAKGSGSKHIAVQHASSFDPASGFAPNTGSLVWVNGSTTTLLAGELNQPVGIKQVDDHTWYVTSLGDGSVLKVIYQ